MSNNILIEKNSTFTGYMAAASRMILKSLISDVSDKVGKSECRHVHLSLHLYLPPHLYSKCNQPLRKAIE